MLTLGRPAVAGWKISIQVDPEFLAGTSEEGKIVGEAPYPKIRDDMPPVIEEGGAFLTVGDLGPVDEPGLFLLEEKAADRLSQTTIAASQNTVVQAAFNPMVQQEMRDLSLKLQQRLQIGQIEKAAASKVEDP